MFIEVLIVVGASQSQFFYGPFSSESERQGYKDFLQDRDRRCCERHKMNLSHIKYFSRDSLPDENWVKLPPKPPFPVVFCWVKPETVPDCLPKHHDE